MQINKERNPYGTSSRGFRGACAYSTPEEREDLREVYDNAGETRYTDVSIRWYISAVMFALNSAMLLFALPLALRGEPAVLLIAGAELWFTLLWYGLERRIQGLVEYWLAKLIAIEELLHPVVRVFGGNEYEEKVAGARFTTHAILVSMILAFSILGLATIIIYARAPAKKSFYLPSPPMEEVVRQQFHRLEKRIEQLEK